MRPGGAASAAHLAQNLPFHHHVAYFDFVFGQMRITCREPIVVIHIDRISILLMKLRPRYHAACGGMHGRAGWRDEINPGVKTAFAIEGIKTVTKI